MRAESSVLSRYSQFYRITQRTADSTQNSRHLTLHSEDFVLNLILRYIILRSRVANDIRVFEDLRRYDIRSDFLSNALRRCSPLDSLVVVIVPEADDRRDRNKSIVKPVCLVATPLRLGAIVRLSLAQHREARVVRAKLIGRTGNENNVRRW